jgi:hypothetical protein
MIQISNGLGQSNSITYHPNLVQAATAFGKLAALKQAGQALTSALNRMNAVSGNAGYGRVSASKREAHLTTGRTIATRMSRWVTTTAQFGSAGAFTNSSADTTSAITQLKSIAAAAASLATKMESDLRGATTRASSTRSTRTSSTLAPPVVDPTVDPDSGNGGEGMATWMKYGLGFLLVGGLAYAGTKMSEPEGGMAGIKLVRHLPSDGKLTVTSLKGKDGKWRTILRPLSDYSVKMGRRAFRKDGKPRAGCLKSGKCTPEAARRIRSRG